MRVQRRFRFLRGDVRGGARGGYGSTKQGLRGSRLGATPARGCACTARAALGQRGVGVAARARSIGRSVGRSRSATALTRAECTRSGLGGVGAGARRRACVSTEAAEGRPRAHEPSRAGARGRSSAPQSRPLKRRGAPALTLPRPVAAAAPAAAAAAAGGARPEGAAPHWPLPARPAPRPSLGAASGASGRVTQASRQSREHAAVGTALCVGQLKHPRPPAFCLKKPELPGASFQALCKAVGTALTVTRRASTRR